MTKRVTVYRCCWVIHQLSGNVSVRLRFILRSKIRHKLILILSSMKWHTVSLRLESYCKFFIWILGPLANLKTVSFELPVENHNFGWHLTRGRFGKNYQSQLDYKMLANHIKIHIPHFLEWHDVSLARKSKITTFLERVQSSRTQSDSEFMHGSQEYKPQFY